jgi:hypothetical protein
VGYFRLPNDNEVADSRSFEFDLDKVFPLQNEKKQLLLSEMLLAFDNLPHSEVSDMLESICSTKDVETCASLLEMTAMMDMIYMELQRRDANQGIEDLEDAARVIRSRIRMYSKSHVAREGPRPLNPPDMQSWPW